VPVPAKNPPDLPGKSLAGALVLVVDDEAAIQQPLRILLQEAGAKTAWAASATEALDAIQRRRPDVIVTDICMPGRDGYDLIRSIRDLPPERGGQVPAIALTGYAASTDRDSALSAGFQEHIAKPVEPAVLIAAIAALVSGSGRAKPR
jgi:CheY-like chemotaxis protein